MAEELRIQSSYQLGRIPAQLAFRASKATVRGYGGAMSGGKSRALCEEVFDWALEYPGIEVPIFRQRHTSLESTTRKTFLEQTLPQELRRFVRVVNSQGRDFVRFWNGSIVHFVGLDDPVKWFSSEIGGAAFDESHEIAEEDVITINTRLRQRCTACVKSGNAECEHMPHQMILGFNPADPGHWLQQWFLQGGTPTEFGYYKERLLVGDAEGDGIGDCEFFFAKATDNPFVSRAYLERNLAGMPQHLRRRYLEGFWEYISGSSFFDTDALLEYQRNLPAPIIVGETCGSLTGDKTDNRMRVRKSRTGPLIVWEPPVRESFDEELGKLMPAHRYVVAVDVSSGSSKDYSAIQVVDIEDFGQVAEFQAKLDVDLLAVEAFRLAAVYNGALVAPEITGGWGLAVTKVLQKLIHGYKGSTASKPRIYTRPIFDRLSQQWTDRLGWDTTTKSRAHMLGTLEQVLREQEFKLRGERTLAELGAFVFPDKKLEQPDYKPPRAQPGANDDLVIALAIGVTLASSMPRQLRRPKPPVHKPQFQLTGY